MSLRTCRGVVLTSAPRCHHHAKVYCTRAAREEKEGERRATMPDAYDLLMRGVFAQLTLHRPRAALRRAVRAGCRNSHWGGFPAMAGVKKIDHVAIAVRSIDESR